jgi:hypothetical protein
MRGGRPPVNKHPASMVGKNKQPIEPKPEIKSDPARNAMFLQRVVKQQYRDFAKRLLAREPNRRVKALKAVRNMMKTRFMKVFALFRLKKYREPLELNESR